MIERGRASTAVVASLLALAAGTRAHAQELEPRAYSPSPVGTNFFAIVAGYTEGAILFDPTVPITDAHSDFTTIGLGYGRTIAVGQRQGLVLLSLPYAWGDAEGVVFAGTPREERKFRSLSGFGDVRVKGSMNLLGPRAASPEQFRTAPRKTILGVSLTVQAPTGQYDETRLVNLGTNRWAFKPEIGVSIPAGRWYLDAYAGVVFFETNDEFFPSDAVRKQDPLTAIQAHASYTFRNRAWLAFDATWYGGGQATVDSGPPSDRENNTRFGGTVACPLTAGQSLKLAYSTGASTRTGTDFDSFAAAWQLRWFDRRH